MADLKHYKGMTYYKGDASDLWFVQLHDGTDYQPSADDSDNTELACRETIDYIMDVFVEGAPGTIKDRLDSLKLTADQGSISQRLVPPETRSPTADGLADSCISPKAIIQLALALDHLTELSGECLKVRNRNATRLNAHSKDAFETAVFNHNLIEATRSSLESAVRYLGDITKGVE